jgi:hypothetical protein
MSTYLKSSICLCLFFLSFIECATHSDINDSINMLSNNDFSLGTKNWILHTQLGGEASCSADTGEMHIHISSAGNQIHSIILHQVGLTIEKGRTYTVSFQAYCASGTRNVYVKIGLAEEPWTYYSELNSFRINSRKNTYSFEFTMKNPTDNNAHLEFQFGTNDTDVYLDDIVLKKTPRFQEFDLESFKFKLGERETLLKDKKFGLRYFPDMCISVLEKSPQYRIIIVAHNSTYLLEGKSIKQFTKCTKVLSPGKKGEFDNGYAGIAGVYRHADGRLYGFYHAEDQEDMPKFPHSGIIGFYASIGLAVSGDNGITWEKAGQVITSQKPKGWVYYEGQVESGTGEPCSTVSKDGEYLYIYYTEHSRVGGRGVQICMARAYLADGPPLPGTWYKYYNGSFSEPGLGGKDTPVLSMKHRDEAEAVFPHVVYSEYLGLYIMILNINFWKEFYYETGLKNSGIYITTSYDGIHWKAPVMLIKDWSSPLSNKSVSWEPTLIFDQGSINEGWLIYSYCGKFGFGQGGSTPSYMVGRRFKIEKNND